MNRQFQVGDRVWFRAKSNRRVAFNTPGTVRLVGRASSIVVVDFGPDTPHYAAWPRELGRTAAVPKDTTP